SSPLCHPMHFRKLYIISSGNRQSSQNPAGQKCALSADADDHNILCFHYLSPSFTSSIASNLHRLSHSPHPVHMVSSMRMVPSAFFVMAGHPGFIHMPHFLHLSVRAL